MRIATLLIVILLQATQLAAQDQPANGHMTDLTEYTFDDTQVLAQPKDSTAELLVVRTRRWTGSLIRIRERFLAELLKSVEQL
jgi:hypothetical protein